MVLLRLFLLIDNNSLHCFGLGAALALASDGGSERCNILFLLSCSLGQGLVLVDNLRLENTLCGIHGTPICLLCKIYSNSLFLIR